MSAPIDDLLYGGDDSGDEEEMHAAPVAMPAFGAAVLPLTPSGITGKPLAAPSGLPGSAVASASLAAAGAKPAAVATPLAVTAPVGVVRPPVASATGAAAQLAKPTATPAPTAVAAPPAAAAAAAAAAAQAKQAPGSGQQMFQQMFALLKQMLSPEQYATFYTEMRNGNGNDIKSIVDIIKRIAGDAMFSTLIQKLDLTRSFPSTAAAVGAPAVKSEPAAVAAPGATPQRTPPGVAAPVAASTSAAAPPRAGSPGLAAKSPAPTAQRPNLLVQTPVNGTTAAALSTAATAAAAVPPPSIITAPAAASVKPEPKAAAAAIATPPAANGTAASPSTASAKNEQLEKIEFAKKLLFHASSCTLASGVCQVTKCDDVRRVFKHSVSCGGARSCSHCEQLKGLVKYHAKECLVAASDHCTIPFCDGLRRAFLSSAAAQAAKKTPPSAGARAGTKAGVTSDDDDDNTPLASAMNKAKKNAAKAKSPKASPTVRPTTTSAVPSAAAAAKKKTPVAAAPTAAKPTTTATASSPAPAANKPAGVTTATAAAVPAAGAAAAPAKAAVNANMTVEYGRLLQLILHVQKCTASPCPVGDECTEAKTLLRDINSPNAPPRAKTYKQVYSHYKVCQQKKNTENCPMCKIGLRPILPLDTSPLASPASQSSTPAAASLAASSAGVTSPSSGKRSHSAVTPSPRSPSKKQRAGGTNRVKSAAPLPDPAPGSSGGDQAGLDLAQASIADIRKEADVLTHTSIDLGGERRTMMDSALRRRAKVAPEQLPCKKEEWLAKDLFNGGKLRSQMQELGQRCGVQLGSHTSDVMAYALNEYLKQVMEEMVEISKQRCDVQARALEQVQKRDAKQQVEVTATDILRVSCEDSFARLRQEDLALRARLLEDAKREELVEKERAKKRKKVDRSKLNQEEKDEVEMDVEELAIKDLKDRLLQEDKDGVVRVDGRVNESISGKFARRLDQQVTMEDATYWLQNQKPYISPKLFARAEAARIVTKSLT